MTEEQTAQDEYAKIAAAGMESDSNQPYVALDALGTLLIAEFTRAEIERRPTEQRWLKDLRQYRGTYDPEVEARIGQNRSKAFMRATRVKVKTVDARTTDLLFPSNSTDRNWTADPTPIPTLDKESMANIFKALGQALGRAPDKKEIDAAALKIVKIAATKMTTVIDDQLAESRYKETARKILHSGHLYGTGVLKAPLVERKTRTKFVLIKGKWKIKVESYVVPFVDYVPLWRFYPDMSATEIENCRYVYELHLFSRADIAGLADRKSFDRKKIKAYILANPEGFQQLRNYDSEIRNIGERSSVQHKDDGQYEVLERWGWIDGAKLASTGVVVPPDREHETFFANIWLLPNGEVIKAVLQPINGVTWPYHLYYFDKDETSIFGDGLASVMRDDQEMINAGVRMVLDNSALSAGPQLEVNMKLLADTETASDMFPFKIWKRNGDDPTAPAIRVIEIPSDLEKLMPIIDMFQKNADDTTAIPRYMQGENATQGAAGTASGMSMLMASASIVMKDLITSYDEGITRPFIEALYRWNMQFNPDNECKGDFDIKARGTASLMAKEVRAQQLDNFAATTANPMDDPYIKREELLRQRAEAHDLTNVVKTEEEVEEERNNDATKKQAQIAELMEKFQVEMAKGALEKLQGENEKLKAEVERIRAQTVKTNVDTAYSGMQAGGVATERSEVAPAGDAILKSAGWIDHTPEAGTPIGTEQAAPIPEQAGQDSNPLTPPSATVGANVGQHAGIETPQIEAQ